MAITPYATTTQYAAWLGLLDASGNGDPSQLTNEADIKRQLARASELITDALVATIYDTDASGNPTDDDVIDALADATCAQVEGWEASGDELGSMKGYSAVSIGSVTLSGPSAAVLGGHKLAPRTRSRLRQAGLLPGRPYV